MEERVVLACIYYIFIYSYIGLISTLLIFTHLWIYSLTNACCCTYSLELLTMGGKTIRNMYSVIPK